MGNEVFTFFLSIAVTEYHVLMVNVLVSPFGASVL